jgi:hypothetical protein
MDVFSLSFVMVREASHSAPDARLTSGGKVRPSVCLVGSLDTLK